MFVDRSVWIFNRNIYFSICFSFQAKFSCFDHFGCDDFMVPVVGEYQVSLKCEPDFISLKVLCIWRDGLEKDSNYSKER